MILIAGAGLAGLSTAFHLGDDARIIEREERPGGLCRTEKIGSYRFDYGGHLLHLRSDYVEGLAKELVGDSLKLFKRKSSIYSNGVTTPYPFQANTHGLPPEVARDCVVGFVNALIEREKGAEAPDNFRDWILHSFGEGFAGHFFFPFNEKFFKRDLSEITDEWVSWSIPRPDLKEVVDGALGVQKSDFGYNVEFYYPEGGIEELPRALAGSIHGGIETGVGLCEVRPLEKVAVLSTGEEVKYDRLVSTVPLDRLLSMLTGVPEEIAGAADKLSVLSVVCVNLGISGPPLTDMHWIYVPGRDYPFHRIGVYSNFLPHGDGRNSLYLEITCPGPVGEKLSGKCGEDASRAAAVFRDTPFFDNGKNSIDVDETFIIKHGYVVYDRFRRDHLPGIIDWLREHGIELCGRYARWEYSTMEDAILEGKEIAERTKGG